MVTRLFSRAIWVRFIGVSLLQKAHLHPVQERSEARGRDQLPVGEPLFHDKTVC